MASSLGESTTTTTTTKEREKDAVGGTRESRDSVKESGAKQPFLMARVVKDPRFLNLDVYQEFKVQLQEVDLKVDQVFLLYLCEYFIWLSNNVFQQ
jgi:hypothetical protein